MATAFTELSWPTSRGADRVAGDRVPDPHRLRSELETMMSRFPARSMATAFTELSWPTSGAPHLEDCPFAVMVWGLI